MFGFKFAEQDPQAKLPSQLISLNRARIEHLDYGETILLPPRNPPAMTVSGAGFLSHGDR